MKKGVVQLQESILVIFFIMIIIVMGLVVFYKFSLNSLHSYENEYREQQLLSSLITIPNYFGYTYFGDSKNAIDTSKLKPYDRPYEHLDYGFKTIMITQVYPGEGETFTIYDKKNIRLKNTLIESRPVSLYFPLEEVYRAGKLTISVYY